jgi:NAD(P)-dependent dehydrogenase (short-subunit alcohol dehydrogenase family)
MSRNSPTETGPVLITGCSTGVGHAAAKLFRQAGYETFATARDASTLEDLRALGCRILALDVTDEAARIAAVKAVEREFGSVGVLVNNAGYGQYGPLEEISLDAIRKQFETNVFGGLRMSQLVIPAMRAKGYGRIVYTSSIAGKVGIMAGGAYHATKFAVEALTDALRPEVQPFGIEVVNVLPGPIATHFEATLLKTIPDTGANSPYTAFKANIVTYMHKFLLPGGFGVWDAEGVARYVVTAATAKHPRTRYRVGFMAKTGAFGRALVPDRLVDAVMRKKIPFKQK